MEYQDPRESISNNYIKQFENCYEPHYLITRVYYNPQYNRERIVKENKRFHDVLVDMFNPRNHDAYLLRINHFIERHSRTFEKVSNQKVLNTIINDYEWDDVREIKEGSFHVHTLVSSIRTDVMNRNIRKAVPEVFHVNCLTEDFIDHYGADDVIMDLMNYTLRKRCDFIGNGDRSLDIRAVDDRKSYGGSTGWKGMLKYVCKNMIDADSVLEIYDYENNDLH